MASPRILVLATGGTIAGMAGSATRQDYRPGQIAIDDYLARAEELGLDARLSGRQIANIGSEDIGFDIWRRLHGEIAAALASDECDGIVVTHGTDTAEETAFLLDLTLATCKPVVLVGAMRPADAVGYDGLRNFANAVRVAGDERAAGRGVLVVMGDRVFAARDVRKVRTRGSEDAFRGFPRGSVALVTPGALEWFGAPWRTSGEARYPFPEQLADVPIIYVHAGLDPDLIGRLAAPDTRGIVIAGVGEGNMPQPVRDRLAQMAARGIVVVRASRVDEGQVDREPDDDANGFVAARAFNPQKARLLLQLLLAGGIADPMAVQAAFDDPYS